ncbi:hypothetical protein BMF94_5988 [Rhodotorula taiwanensis]|uniref:C2H2-type domain-containing protein n=1 Tax=Rhodotorula taiwanensis TaxID=741276 RepID=A0A2S5B2Z6_9BASI|nr:hypothetical protein BMF94_5988 [Rhodotorula taiwanensis]
MRPYPTSRPASRLQYGYAGPAVRDWDFEMQQGAVESTDQPSHSGPPGWSAPRVGARPPHDYYGQWTGSDAGPAMQAAFRRPPPSWNSPWSSAGGHAPTHTLYGTTSRSQSRLTTDSIYDGWHVGASVAGDEHAFSTAERQGNEIEPDDSTLTNPGWLAGGRHVPATAEFDDLDVDDHGSQWESATPASEYHNPFQGLATYRDPTDWYHGSFSSESDHERYDQRPISMSSSEGRPASSFEVLEGRSAAATAGSPPGAQFLPRPWTAVNYTRLDYSTLPPLPDSPPLSAAAYSLGSPAGRTFSSFAALSLEATDTPEYSSYLGENDMQDVSFIPGERPPFVECAARSAQDTTRFQDLGHSREAPEHLSEAEDDVRVKFEPDSTPDLPPTASGPFSVVRGGAHPSDQIIAGQSSSPLAHTTYQGRGPTRSTRKNVVRDYTSDEDDEEDFVKEESPEWMPAASTSSGRPVKSPRTSRSVRRGSGGSGKSAPQSSYATAERISPITGMPVKAISKRSWPPKDAHKRKFACPIAGCDKTFGRPSARDTHLRSHSGQKR